MAETRVVAESGYFVISRESGPAGAGLWGWSSFVDGWDDEELAGRCGYDSRPECLAAIRDFQRLVRYAETEPKTLRI